MRLSKVIDKIKFGNFILSISYGNYRQSFGGTDKVILSHQSMLNEAGISCLYIFPVAKTLRVNQIKVFRCWGLIIDGSYMGIFDTTDIINLIIKASYKKQFKDIFVHHFLGIDIGQLERILDLSDVPINVYIHDYYMICTQLNLMKNDESYCGKDRISDKKCINCTYYDESKTHVKQVEDFFEKYNDRITVVAPSESAKVIWSSTYPLYKDHVKVLNHQTFIGEYEGNCKSIGIDDKVKIAFVGAQAKKKGWQQWENVVSTINKNSKGNKEFYHFGKTNDVLEYIIKIPVSFQKDGINAMVTALRKNNIDCVILWSLCPETYSYTYYESTAANSFIITNQFSGNIADAVKERHNGIVLKNMEELRELLENEDRLKSLINTYREQKKWGPSEIIENRELLKNISLENGRLRSEQLNERLSIFRKMVKFILGIVYKFYMKIYANRRLK